MNNLGNKKDNTQLKEKAEKIDELERLVKKIMEKNKD